MHEAGVAVTASRLAADAASRLIAAGVDTPVLDAQLLLAHASGLSRERLLIDYDQPLSGEVAARLEALLVRRAAREPVAYILGRKEFRRVTLAVDPRVLVPRPETELLVDVGHSLGRGARVVDVGTGSGAVALALKDERPDLEVWATDVSADALAVARENALELGLEVQLLEADLLDGVPGPFDAVLANLPYVADGAELAPEITDHEPPEALFAGPDGLRVIRRLVATVSAPLVALEVGSDQAAEVRRLMDERGLRSIVTIADLAGHDRVLVGRQ